MTYEKLFNGLFHVFIYFTSLQSAIGTVEVDGEPIPGVNIINNSTGNGTLSDFDGNFSIDNLSEGDEIEFSYIGFTTQRVFTMVKQT